MRTEILPLATSHITIAQLRNHRAKYIFALLIFMPHFKSINFYQNKPKIKLILEKIQNFRELELHLQTPKTDPLPLTAYFWIRA